ncbi:MAG: hypothetical protein HY070_01585 [Chloroflexi bacterium]|nr:hypothetical protein [Chloroflexota bacterium]
MLTTRRLFTAILFLAVFVMSAREIQDPDFWWHLRTGQFILETQTIPHSDIYSFTRAGAPWIAHEWLSEVFIYALYRLAGFPALILIFSAIITLAFAFVYARCEGKPYSAAFVLLFAALATAPTWGVRPQMISLLLTSVFLFVLDTSVIASEPFDFAQGKLRERSNLHFPTWGLLLRFAPRNDAFGIWLLVPLTVLWVNLHSGYALGIVVIAVYWFGELVRVIASPERAKQSPNFNLGIASSQESLLAMTNTSSLVTLSIILFVTIAVVPLNPNGAMMYTYPFDTLTSRAMQTYIQEWFSPDFHLNEFQPFAFLLLATFASFALTRRRVTPTDLFLLAGFAYAALRSARNIPLFAIIAAPILAANVWEWITTRGWNKVFASRAETSRLLAAINWLILILILGVSVARVFAVISNQTLVERAKFPAAAVDFIAQNKLSAPLYNAYGWGGYLIWRRYPDARVFIDGRADVYGDKFIEEFLRTYRGEGDWRAGLDKYDVKLILVEPDAPLLTPLALDAQWKKIYADENAVIYQKNK